MRAADDTPTKKLTVRLPEPLWRQLHAAAGRRAISVHRLMLEWLTEKAAEAEVAVAKGAD